MYQMGLAGIVFKYPQREEPPLHLLTDPDAVNRAGKTAQALAASDE